MIFETTEQAIEFGRQATLEDIEKLKRAEKINAYKFEYLMSKTYKTVEDFYVLSKIATQEQFCHEALQYAKGGI